MDDPMNDALEVMGELVYHPYDSDRDEDAISHIEGTARDTAVAELRDARGRMWEIVVRPL